MTSGIRLFPTEITRVELAELINTNSSARAQKFDRYVYVQARDLDSVAKELSAFLKHHKVKCKMGFARHSNHMGIIKRPGEGLWEVQFYGEEIGYLTALDQKLVITDMEMQLSKDDLADLIAVMP